MTSSALGLDGRVGIGDWFLSPAERANPSTQIDRRHDDGVAWTRGNHAEALVHGSTYFAELVRSVRAMGDGDLLLFTDWRGDPDEHLEGAGAEVSEIFADGARRGV